MSEPEPVNFRRVTFVWCDSGFHDSRLCDYAREFWGDAILRRCDVCGKVLPNKPIKEVVHEQE